MIPTSLDRPRYGDKRNSDFFEEFLVKLLEDRDRDGLTGLVHAAGVEEGLREMDAEARAAR